jgi:hypothetical protein
MVVNRCLASMRSASCNFFGLTNLGTLALGLACAGCGSIAGRTTAVKAPTLRVINIGQVAVVNEERRFVLIDLESSLYVPAPGVALRTLQGSTETGRLKVSPEWKRPFVAADILGGEPKAGDRVVQ